MPKLNQPQARFLRLDKKFKALVCGFGTGKTWGGCADLCKFAWEWPGVNAGYFAPTYPMIRDIFFPTMEEVAADWGLEVDIKETDKEVHFYSGGVYRNTVLCRSMENPGSIVGFKIGKALVDELDVMTKAKAEHAWRKIIARLRQNADGLQNGVSVTTTPEGYRFVYDQFVKQLRDKPELANLYGLVQASTYENAKNLPADYIPSLRASYPPNLISAYIKGQFTNLASGSVYPEFDRHKNGTTATIQPGEVLHIGQDFNVLNGTAIVCVIREGKPLALAEHTKERDTPAMADKLKARYLDKGHTVIVYPDASGQNTSSKNASESDLSIMRQRGFHIEVNNANPAVKDRVNAVNAMILSDFGERRLKVNVDNCPTLTESLEQQAYAANGEPDKTSGHDHACFTGDTLVDTPDGPVRFDELPPAGQVLGPSGEFVSYEFAGLTKEHAEIVEIEFADGYLLKCTPEHQFLTVDGSWIQARDLLGHECVSLVNQFKNSRATATTPAGTTSPTAHCLSEGSIELSGLHTTGRCQTAITSITKTATKQTTSRRIFAVSLGQTTSLSTQARMTTGFEYPRWPMNSDTSRNVGTLQKLVAIGIVSITNFMRLLCMPSWSQPAHAAASGSLLHLGSTPLLFDSAQTPARHTHAGRLELTTLLSSASLAAASSQRTNMEPASVVRRVTRLAQKADVYCLSVPQAGCFKLTRGGPIVSNCDALGYMIHKRWPIVRPTFAVQPLRA